MLVTFTDEENMQFAEINNKYKELRAKAKTQEERLKSYTDQQDELQALYDSIQQQRFDELGADPRAVLEHAQEQLPEIIEVYYDNLLKSVEIRDLDTYEEAGVAKEKGDKLYFFPAFILSQIKEELSLHIAFLEKNDTESLQKLYDLIITELSKSGYIFEDDAEKEITPDAFSKALMPIRAPLARVINFGIMNDKTTHIVDDEEIFKEEIDGQLKLNWVVDQSSETEVAYIPVYMALSYEGEDYKVTKKLTAYDKQVCEAIATRYYYHKLQNPNKPLHISPQEIWRTMNGKRNSGGKPHNPTDKQIKRIRDSMDKMRFTRFYMDITKEIEARNLVIDDERIRSGNIETYFIKGDKITFLSEKGKEINGYQIDDEPILYTYNRIKNRVLFVPYELLDTSKFVGDSENVAEFKGYLLQQILLMKNAKEEKHKGKYFKRNDIIKIDTIYKGTGIQTPEERIEEKTYKTEASKQKEIRRLRREDRKKIIGILDAWKDKEWIKGYAELNSKNEPVKEKQPVKAFRIKL